MVTTIAVDPQTAPSSRTTSAASRRPPPPPPKSAGTVSAEQPRLGERVDLLAGEVAPDASTSRRARRDDLLDDARQRVLIRHCSSCRK